MQSTHRRRYRIAASDVRARRLLTLAAASVGALAFAGPASAQLMFFDNNGATSGLGSGAGTWNAALANWATTSSPGTTAPGTWVAGSTANFNAGFTVHLADTESVGGLIFNTGATTIDTATGAVNPLLDFGSSAFSFTTTSTVGTSRQIIAAPIKGSGDMTVNLATTGPLELAGDMSQFTGNIYLNNTAANPATTAVDFQINNSVGSGATTIYMDQNARLNNNNPNTFNGVATPRNYTISSNVVLNYNAVNNANNYLSSSNGDGGTSTYGQATFVAGTQLILTFAGVISSPGSVNTNVVFGLGASGGRGTVVLANHNTWNGNTQVVLGANNGLLQMGIDNALPTSTVLSFGSGSSTVAPMDLNGHSLTIGGLGTNTTANNNNGNGGADNGNIYNTSISGSPAASATITIAGSANTTYAGNIGSTNLSVNPFNDNAPYVTGNASLGTAQQIVQASTDISLVINGPGSLTLAPVSNHQNGNQYTGTTTVNGGTLKFGRAGSYPSGGAPGTAYTLTGGGNVNVNSGGTLSSNPTTFGASPTYVGGASGMITLNSGATLTPGGAGATGFLASNSMTINAGANLNFEFGTSSQAFDSLYLNGGLTLDTAGNSTLNLGLATGVTTVTPGTYTLITAAGGINWDTVHGLTLGTVPSVSGGYTFGLQTNGNLVQVVVNAAALRWDPSGNGAANPPVQELGGTWQAGSSFVDLSDNTEAMWDNSTTKDVIIGNDVSQAGDIINLGSDITVNGKLTFGPIFPLYNYSINGNGHTLTLGGGLNVNNTAATSTTPSAEIDSPIVLAADQTWNVDAGQFLEIKGSLTGSHALTKVGAGTLDLNAAGGSGSIGQLNVNGGIVLLGAPDSIGTTTPISLNGGGVEFSVDGTPANPITIGSNGGSLGATNQPGGGPAYNVTFTNNITGGNPLAAIGTGNLSFSGNITASTFTSSTSTSAGGGTVTLSGNNSFSAINITGGNLVAASSGALGAGATPITLTGGTLTLATDPSNITLNSPINIGTNGSANMSISSAVPVTLAGVISGNGNVNLFGPDYTLSNANTNGNSVVPSTDGMTLHVTSATGLGTATLAYNANVTLNTPVDTSANAIRSSTAGTSYTLTKTGTGTLTLTGSGSVNSVPGAKVVIEQGAIQMNNIASVGTTNVTSTPGLDIAVNSGASLLLNWSTSGTRYSGNITLNGGSIVRPNNSTNGDYQLSIFGTNDATLLFNPAPTFTVTADSTVHNQVTNQPDSLTVSRDILLEMPVVINSGATLTAMADGGTQDLTHATIIFRGVSNNTTYAYQNITLQPGAALKTAGPGEIDLGGTGRGMPIIANGTPGNDAKLLLTAGHTFLRDAGSANQNTGNTDMTRFVINGTGSAGLRVEAPMNAVYVKLPDNTMDGCTTGLFGLNTVAAPNGNGFTIFTPNRAAALSNTYTLPDTTVITPQGTLTLAATDPSGATGVVNAGPQAPVNLALALDNTATSGNLLYQLDGQAANGARLLNFSGGITVERSNPSAGTVAGQLLSNSHVASLTLNDSTTFDLADHALAVQSVGSIPSYLSGHALYSSAVDADTHGVTTIAIINGADLGGMTTFAGISNIDSSTTIYAPAYYGDINLDGRINADDYALMDRSVAKGLTPNWIDGDFNADNAVNAIDYFLMDKAFGVSNGGVLSPGFLSMREAQFGPDYVAQLVAAVPEPTSLSLLSLAALPALSRRRRHR